MTLTALLKPRMLALTPLRFKETPRKYIHTMAEPPTFLNRQNYRGFKVCGWHRWGWFCMLSE
jgi:hypothetical protein